MTILDTHIWIWWIHGDTHLPEHYRMYLESVESTQLPGAFHRDLADQLIVATARVHHCPSVMVDTKILAYPHVQTEP